MCRADQGNEDIFADVEKPSAEEAEPGRAPDPNSSPDTDMRAPSSPQRGSNAAERLDSRGGAEPLDAAEEGKRARLRKVIWRLSLHIVPLRI